MRRTSFFVLAGVIAAAVLSTRPAFAGPPLVCFPFDIGQARSLPILQSGYGAVDPKYDVAHLVTGQILTTIDGQTTEHLPGDYWTVKPGATMRVKAVGEVAVLETTVVAKEWD